MPIALMATKVIHYLDIGSHALVVGEIIETYILKIASQMESQIRKKLIHLYTHPVQ